MPRLSRRQRAAAVVGAIAINTVGLVLIVKINEHVLPSKAPRVGRVEVVSFNRQQREEKRRRARPHELRVKQQRATMPLPNLPSGISAASLGLSLAGEADLFSDMLGQKAGLDGDLILKEEAVDVPPRVIARVAPEYPRRAEEREIEGHVVFKLRVSREGQVERVWILESEPPGVFDAAAEKAVRQFRFSPARYHDRPVPVLAKQRLVFRLGGNR
jgi:protein TonB